MNLTLYGYWRSSASYRVRIALNLKGLKYRYVPVHLVRDGGEQHSTAYRQLNSAGLVPTLINEDEDIILTQSLSIIEYLDERYYDAYPLLPNDTVERAKIRALAQDVACDIQPMGNLRVLNTLKRQFKADDTEARQWVQKWTETGFRGIEQRLQTQAGKFCFGFDVSLADVCLVPQVYNARRFGVDMQQFPLVSKIAENCNALDAFKRALPENQSDAQ